MLVLGSPRWGQQRTSNFIHGPRTCGVEQIRNGKLEAGSGAVKVKPRPGAAKVGTTAGIYRAKGEGAHRGLIDDDPAHADDPQRLILRPRRAISRRFGLLIESVFRPE